ncbi:hypothetical protein C8J56DRAFT_849427 [Mycena floridula]|nr:hypothetical protein C8J56DRAFT_849427 [Mycena floridula]
MASTSTPKSPLSYADRAKKAYNSRAGPSRPPAVTNSDPAVEIERPPSPNGILSSPKEDRAWSQKPAVVNVWDIRKEQMAAARATASRLPPSKSLQIGSSSSSSQPIPPSSHSVDSLSSQKLNGSVPPPLSPDENPFVVRVPVLSRPPPAPAEDVTVWPEVGKSPLPAPAVLEEEPNREPETTASTPRKTKWVPIPAQELQAAADAALKSSHSRNQSQHSNTNKPPRMQGPGSASGSGPEQGRHSSRNSVSHSVSQSRVQSRSGSVQSSPRFPRGRKLPNEEPSAIEFAENIIIRTSRMGSPQPSHLRQPQAQGYVDPNITNFSPLYPVQPPVNGGTTYYPQPSIPQGHNHAPYSSHTPPSFANGYQPLPPPGYGNPTPYPIYQNPGQYEYSQGPAQPYMYWNGSGHNTPPYPQQPISHFSPHQFPSNQHYQPPPINIEAEPPSQPPEASSNGFIEQPVMFGSIGVDEPSSTNSGSDVNSIQRSFSVFSIGIESDERPRTRTKSNKAHGRVDALAELTNGEAGPQIKKPDERVEGAVNLVPKTETKWEFGTTSQPDDLTLPPPPPPPSVPSIPVGQHMLPPPPQDLPTRPSLIAPPFPDQRFGSLSPLEVESSTQVSNEWEVQDFGYGFGHASGSGYAATMTRDEMAMRARERELNRDRMDRERFYEREREMDKDRENVRPPRDMEHVGRPRRGSYNGGFHERGRGFRRGRGSWRGFPGSYQSHASPPSARHSSQYSVTPPPSFQTLAPANEVAPNNGYYTTYIPQPYDSYPQPPPSATSSSPSQAAPPVPMPLSSISFPLDATRFYLLGQLEYYLSPQNMAQDIFLRRRMDSKGWIPIELIASFNRVKRLAADVQLVHDVLALSSVVQVQDQWVRMIGWESFLMPDAPESCVRDFNSESASGKQQVAHENENDEEDEEDDVVFVMDREAAGGPGWYSGRH